MSISCEKNWTSETEKNRLRYNYLISSVDTLANNAIDQWEIALLLKLLNMIPKRS